MKKYYLITVILIASFILFMIHREGTLSGNNTSSAAGNSNLESKMDIIDSFSKPALHLISADKKTFSKIGGTPALPQKFTWPSFKNRPLSFLMQIKFSEINGNNMLKGFPSRGLLYVFYDQDQSTWGFEPGDRTSWRIVFIEDETTGVKNYNYPPGLGDQGKFNEKFISGNYIKSYPSIEDSRIYGLKLDDDQIEQYIDYINRGYNDKPKHLLGGYPDPQQGDDMDLESQLASNGIYCGDSSGYNTPKAKTLEQGRQDWILLLQVDSDDDTGMMWGDVGMLYFWIKKKDLEQRNFDNVWMILQCS